jgi:VanZ family protein
MTRSYRLQWVLRAVWFAAILIVIVVSLLPWNSPLVRAIEELQINDKFWHVAAYMGLAFLPAIHEPRRRIVTAAVGAAALGVALEFGQLVSGWREFEIGDMAADAIGVCIGVAIGIHVGNMDIVRRLFPRDLA